MSTAGPATTAATVVSGAPTIAALVGVTPRPDHVDAAPSTSPSVAAATSYLATHRDTPYAVATKYFPADRVDEIRDRIVELNLGRALPDGSPYQGGGFPAGWSVLLPEPAQAVSTAASPAVETAPAAPHRGCPRRRSPSKRVTTCGT